VTFLIITENKFKKKVKVPCKGRISVNSGAWLRRFDDITGVKKICVARDKKMKEKCCIIAT